MQALTFPSTPRSTPTQGQRRGVFGPWLPRGLSFDVSMYIPTFASAAINVGLLSSCSPDTTLEAQSLTFQSKSTLLPTNLDLVTMTDIASH
jgi:hypothetical protein